MQKTNGNGWGWLAIAAVLALASSAQAAALTNATLYTTIDPAGGTSVGQEAAGATPLATLNGLSDRKVIQDWNDSVTNVTRADLISAGGQIISFTDATRPDIKMKLSGNYASDAGIPADSQGTSQSAATKADAVIFRGTTSGPITNTIDFGNWNGTTFDVSVNSVRAAGFTLSSAGSSSEAYEAKFYKNDGTVLSTQTASGGAGNLVNIYFGYQSSANDIGYVTLVRTNYSATRAYFDDLGFTPFPQAPSGTVLSIR